MDILGGFCVKRGHFPRCAHVGAGHGHRWRGHLGGEALHETISATSMKSVAAANALATVTQIIQVVELVVEGGQRVGAVAEAVVALVVRLVQNQLKQKISIVAVGRRVRFELGS